MRTNYRYYISFLLLCLIIPLSKAQEPQIKENWVLDKDESTETKKYIARDSITLKADATTNFWFSAPKHGQSFSAKIDPGLLFPPTNQTYMTPSGNFTDNPSEGVVVGSIPGQFAVSPTGAATYTIPIEVPVGINGMQPNISLVYNSQGGNGTVGLGWQISGLSAVDRTTKNIFSDAAISGLDLSKKEKYALDGNTLLLLPSDKAYGDDGATYKTEDKTDLLIQSIGSNNVLSDPISSMNTTYCTYPLLFKITTKDGQVIEYGNTNDAKIIPVNHKVVGSTETNPPLFQSQPFQWLINKTTDANGNSVIYKYIEEVGLIPTLKSITYGNMSIEFNYDQKAVAAKTYINGYYLLDKYLLRSICILSKGITTQEKTIKQYNLDYNYDNQKEKYYLKDISLSGTGYTKLNSTKIEWGTDKAVTNLSSATVPYEWEKSSNFSNQQFLSADIDNDGYTDILHFFHGTSYNFMTILKGTLVNNQYTFNDNYWGMTLPSGFELDKLKTKQVTGGIMVCDFNGDGKKTIVIPKYVEKKIFPYAHQVEFVEMYSDESFSSVNSNLTHVLHDYTGITAYANGDINNDGIDEIISIEQGSTTATYNPAKICYIKKNLTYFSQDYDADKLDYDMDEIVSDNNAITDWQVSGIGSQKPKEVIISDFDGDGLKDLFITTSTACYFFKNNGGITGTNGIVQVTFSYKGTITDFNSESSSIKSGDFNGDGLMDFVFNEHCNSTWKLATNNGRWGFDFYPLANFSAIEEEYTTKNDDKEDCIVVDFNHDGKSDIIMIDAVYSFHDNWFSDPWGEYEHTNIIWYNSLGTSFGITRQLYKEDESYSYKRYNNTGDFDGDGKEDILVFGSDLYSGLNKSDNFFISSAYSKNNNLDNSNFEANQVKYITDGMSLNSEITYQPLTHSKTNNGKDFYTKENNSVYPVTDIAYPLNCVKSIKQPIDNDNSSITEYTYSGAKEQLTGKGFLGFTSQTVSNAANNTKVVSITELELPFCLPKTQTVIRSALAAYYTEDSNYDYTISKTETTFTNTKSSDNVYLSLPKKSVETNCLDNLLKITEYVKYDTNGNLTNLKISQGDLTITQTIGYEQYGSWAWCPNKVVSDITTRKLAGGTEVYTREKTFEYDDITGNLIQEISDPTDTKNKLTTTYSDFDIWGHPQTVSVEIPGKTARKSYVKYTDSGRFVDNKINLLGEKTKYNWGDEVSGLLSSEADYLDHITTYTYNGLGQLTETKYANGIRKANVVQWAKSDNIFDAKYYSYSETSGSAPVWVWYDAFGREIVKQTYGLGGKTINVFTKYLPDGKVDRVSEPTFVEKVNLVANDKWAAKYNYDDPYGRLRVISTPQGSTSTDYYPIDRAVLITTPDGTDLKIMNNIGQIESSMVNGKTVTYTYDPAGRLKTSTPESGKTLTLNYDLQGNRKYMNDPDAGEVYTTYNGFGELEEVKQIVHNNKQQVKITYNYFANGLIDNTVRENIENFETQTPTVLHSETTSYLYDTEPKHTNRIKTIKINEGNKQTLGYDSWDRVTSVEETVGTKVFKRKTEYDFFGRVKKEIYPTDYYTTNTYDNYGNLIEVKDSQRSIWLAVDENAKGQLLHEKKGGKVTSYDYYNDGLLKQIKANGVIDMFYEYDDKNNLYSREDKHTLTSQKEVFEYDDLNRLTNWTVTRGTTVTPYSMTYDDLTDNLGNICTKSGIETNPENLLTMSYGGKRSDGSDTGPHALTTISGVPASPFPSADLNVTYTDFKKIATLSEGIGLEKKDYYLTYGVDNQRRMSVYKEGGVTKLTRYYLGDYEEEVGADNKVRKIHYLSGAILIQEDNEQDKFYYTYADYQGSLIASVDGGGNIQNYAYDPWGVRRNPDDWTMKDERKNLIVNRGYTGHEHLDSFGIINMNGRVYDPLTAQFFSPDPFIQSMGSWANYNRYTYCMNNPFKYIDPSGYIWEKDEYGNYNYDAGSGAYQSRFNEKGLISYNWSTGQYQYANGEEASIETLKYQIYSGPNSVGFRGYDAKDFFKIFSSGYQIRITDFYNRTGVVFSKGDPGIYAGIAGDYGFTNKTSFYLEGLRMADMIGEDLLREDIDPFVKFIQATATAANVADVAISTTEQIIQTTRLGADFAYAISGNSKLVNVVSNTFKYFPYVGLGVTVITGSYLSTQINPATGRPYQSVTETGTDIGVNIATIYIGAKYGGWYGVGASVLYMSEKSNFQTVKNDPSSPLSKVILAQPTYSYVP